MNNQKLTGGKKKTTTSEKKYYNNNHIEIKKEILPDGGVSMYTVIEAKLTFWLIKAIKYLGRRILMTHCNRNFVIDFILLIHR